MAIPAHYHCIALAYSGSIGFQNYLRMVERRITLQGVSFDPPQDSVPDGDRAAKVPGEQNGCCLGVPTFGPERGSVVFGDVVSDA